MNPTDLWRFRWRAISYFGAAAFSAASTGLVVAAKSGSVDVLDIVICTIGAAAAGFGAIKALFDQKVDTTTSPEKKEP